MWAPVTSLVIVDDYAPFRHYLRMLLDGDGFEVVGEADHAAAAVSVVSETRPQLVLLDVQLLGGDDGFEVAERLAELDPAPRVVLMSSREARDFGPRLERAPVVGFVAKHELSLEAIGRLAATSPSHAPGV
jgi:DNA-binding NarL/FixJ family response regulator